ncbi:MAG: riboflavin kinase [Firmicutes bacterium]|nr:riboflavin kinase [Bacillota bacterium]
MPEGEFLREFRGTVVKGKGMGRALGFPTANLAMADAPGLRHGVYAARVRVEDTWYEAVVNVGRHPTLPGGPLAVEAHMPGRSLDLYGRTVTVRLLRFLRGERRFDSPEALAEQIGRDIASLNIL